MCPASSLLSPQSPTQRQQLLHQLPPQPWGTKWLDRLRLLSPKAWIGFYQYVDKSPFTALEGQKIIQGFLQLMLPMILVLLIQHSNHHNHLNNLNLLPVYLMSPWSWHCVFGTMGTPVRQLTQAAKQLTNYRSVPLPEAFETVHQLVKESRIIRERRYDLYLPSNLTPYTTTASSSFDKNTNNLTESEPGQLPTQQQALLLIPGATVNHASYATVAKILSDAGYMVVVPSLEPMRLAQPKLGSDLKSICRIMKHAEAKLKNVPCQWTLMGHSLGSFAVIHLAQQIHSHSNTDTETNTNTVGQKYCPDLNLNRLNISNKIVLWGTMYAPQYASKHLKDSPVEMLLIQGDKDFLLALTQPYRTLFMSNYISKQCTHTTLKGGTHSGFASYQSPIPEIEGKGVLSRAKQQQLSCRETLRFLQQQQQPKNADNNPFLYPRYRSILDIS